jgi:hypothetical protein
MCSLPVTWEFRGAVLKLSVIAEVTNQEIESAISEALANAPYPSDMRLLWDARETQTAVTSSDMAWRFDLVLSLAERGIVSRAALLLGGHHRATFDFSRAEMQKALSPLPCEVFADAAEALAWLEG